MLCRPPSSPGVYLLLLESLVYHAVRVDRRGSRIAVLEPGLYVYVGSAWGPGGLAARIARHIGARRKRRLHWHIDRILASEYVRPVALLYAIGCRGESRLASMIASVAEPLPGIGSTDDPSASSHFFRLRGTRVEQLERLLVKVCGLAESCSLV